MSFLCVYSTDHIWHRSIYHAWHRHNHGWRRSNLWSELAILDGANVLFVSNPSYSRSLHRQRSTPDKGERERERCRGRIAATIICRRKRRRGWRRLRGSTSRGSPPSATPNPPGASTPLSTRTPSSRPILTPSPSSISSGILWPVARFLVTPIYLIALSFDSDAVFSFICYLDSVSSVQWSLLVLGILGRS